MKNHRFSLREVTILTLPLLLILLAVFSSRVSLYTISPFYQATQKSRRQGCASNLRSISMAMSLYSKDYDRKLSMIGQTPNSGWAVKIQPYLKSTAPYQCPNETTPSNGSPTRRGYVDFWFNANLSGQAQRTFTFPNATLMIGEGNDGTDLTDSTYSKSSIPTTWLSDEKSPAYRHLGGANYLMTDGTVHWLKPDEVTTFGGRKDAFALR